MPNAHDLLNKLPDKEKAKIANTLLADVRQRFGSERLGLVANDTPDNLAVDFWRVSSTDQRDGYSLGAQESKATEYKKTAGLKSVKSWAVSESASKEFDRKRFFEMISYVIEHGIKNVVFDKIDRACRGLRAAVLIEDLIESGVRFHFVRDNLVVDKHSSPSEKLRLPGFLYRSLSSSLLALRRVASAEQIFFTPVGSTSMSVPNMAKLTLRCVRRWERS